jgi:hypothetical protein
MSSSAFINALRRFVSIRGKVRIVRSDRGTNFIGATDDMKIDTVNVEDKTLKQFMYNSGTTWITLRTLESLLGMASTTTPIGH